MVRHVVCLLGILSFNFLLSPAKNADDVQCTVKLEACGELEQSFGLIFKSKVVEGSCLKADLATIGKPPSGGLYYTAYIWVGVSVEGDTLVFGKGAAKTGAVIECTWEPGKPKPQNQIASLKKSLPALLNDDSFKKSFPKINKIDVSRMRSVKNADKPCSEVVAEFVQKNK